MKSCADCVCMVRTAKRNWCRPWLNKDASGVPLMMPYWKNWNRYRFSKSIALDEKEFPIADVCRMFKTREDPKP